MVGNFARCSLLLPDAENEMKDTDGPNKTLDCRSVTDNGKVETVCSIPDIPEQHSPVMGCNLLAEMYDSTQNSL